MSIDDIGGAELSHHSTEQQDLCEQRRMLPFFANRPDIGDAELSTTALNSRLGVSGDGGYLVPQTGQTSVV